MKKNLLRLVACGLVLMGISTSYAQILGMDNFYIQASGNITWLSDIKFRSDDGLSESKREFEVGGGGALELGYICDQFRLAVEGVYFFNDLDRLVDTDPVDGGTDNNPDGDNQTWAIMFNAYYDIPLYGCFSAYIGAGIGIAFNELELNSFHFEEQDEGVVLSDKVSRDTLFAWQVKGGLSYAITECWDIFAGYRLFSHTKPKNAAAEKKSEDIPLYHSIDLGIRFRL